jgi:hypothetical protein
LGPVTDLQEAKKLKTEMIGDFDTRNKILLALRPAAIAFLESRAVVKRLSQGQVLYKDGEPFTHAIFPHEGGHMPDGPDAGRAERRKSFDRR